MDHRPEVPREVSLGCARCGSCCKKAYLNVTFEELEDFGSEDALFIVKHWHRNPGAEHYACDMLGEDGLCTAYDSRPPVCSGYPWYGREPSQEQAGHLGDQCSYLLDVPPEQRPEGSRPLIPLTVL